MTPALAAALARVESALQPALDPTLEPAEGRVSTTRREAPPRNGVSRTLDGRDDRGHGVAR
ncbi:hypothetical protein MMX123_00679 [Microbacterium sp. MM2322]